MSIQTFLDKKITWQPTVGNIERSFNGKYVRVSNFSYNGNKKNTNLTIKGNYNLEPFLKDSHFTYFTTKENIENHKKEGELS